jgi:hypothetical protein
MEREIDWTKDTTQMPFDLKPLDAKIAQLHRIRERFAKRWRDKDGNLTLPVKAVYKLSCDLDDWEGAFGGDLAHIADRQICKFLGQPDPYKESDLADLDIGAEV